MITWMVYAPFVFQTFPVEPVFVSQSNYQKAERSPVSGDVNLQSLLHSCSCEDLPTKISATTTAVGLPGPGYHFPFIDFVSRHFIVCMKAIQTSFIDLFMTFCNPIN